ncbi:membrane progestin receptor beta-like [Neosynchiropus ocellatus]
MVQVSFSPPTICLALLPALRRLLPSLPPTVRDVDVPPLFRERYILSGYRPVGQSWRCYFLSLFQLHNETLNVWSHLLAALCIALRFLTFSVFQGGGILGFRLQGPEGQGFSLDVSSMPLILYVCSSVTYLTCSAAAHLLQSHSERAHYSLFFLDYVGVAVYQYGCSLALYLYSSDSVWRRSALGQIHVFLPASAFLAWLSCSACCFAKLRFQRPYPLHRKLCQVGPMGVAYLLDISPVIHRLSTQDWTSSPAMPLHLLQVVLFLLAAFFFSCPIPERLSPGRYDIIGHGHQLFHLLLSLCTLVQQEALYEDFLTRRPALIRMFGEERILAACVSFVCLTLCCVMTANHMSARVVARLKRGHR